MEFTRVITETRSWGRESTLVTLPDLKITKCFFYTEGKTDSVYHLHTAVILHAESGQFNLCTTDLTTGQPLRILLETGYTCTVPAGKPYQIHCKQSGEISITYTPNLVIGDINILERGNSDGQPVTPTLPTLR